MATRFLRQSVSGFCFAFLGLFLAGGAAAQDTQPPPEKPGTTIPAPPSRNPSYVRRAIQWKRFDYTCEGGAKLTVYLHDETAKIRYADQLYLMKQTESADGNRYSDGKVIWWGKGNGGFLQEDTPDGDGKMLVKDCHLDKPTHPGTAVTGTVSYLQRMALPPNAVVLVQLLDVSLADAPAKVIAEERFDLAGKQVPIPFELHYDATRIDPKHTYAISAKISADDKLLFTTDQSYRVITQGNPATVELILKQAAASNR